MFGLYELAYWMEKKGKVIELGNSKDIFRARGRDRPNSGKRLKRTMALGLVLIGGGLVFALSLAQAAPKTYWHFTIHSAMDGNKAEEWMWITMVELSKAETFSETAEKVERLGGAMPGTILAHVRGAAWRNTYRYEKSRKCRNRPSRIEISWYESWSDQVFAHGQISAVGPDQPSDQAMLAFRFGLCDKQVLREDGQNVNLSELVHAFVGPIVLPGSEREELVGKVRPHGINYEDMLVHYKFCDRAWAEQLQTPLLHYESYNLKGYFLGDANATDGIEHFEWHGFSMEASYAVLRSHSREHPAWKQKRLR